MPWRELASSKAFPLSAATRRLHAPHSSHDARKSSDGVRQLEGQQFGCGDDDHVRGVHPQANGQYPVPGENGCDAPTTVTVPWQVTIIHPPIKK